MDNFRLLFWVQWIFVELLNRVVRWVSLFVYPSLLIKLFLFLLRKWKHGVLLLSELQSLAFFKKFSSAHDQKVTCAYVHFVYYVHFKCAFDCLACNVKPLYLFSFTCLLSFALTFSANSYTTSCYAYQNPTTPISRCAVSFETATPVCVLSKLHGQAHFFSQPIGD